jgi:hypothetical protein
MAIHAVPDRPRPRRRLSRSLAATLGAAAVLGACAAPPAAAPAPPAAAAPVAEHAIVHPIAGRSSVVDTFGAPRSGGRTHAGQDVFAAKHTPVVAVADGRITAVTHSNAGLSGNYLQLTADDGWKYLYIHLNNDRPGTDDGANRYDQAFADGVIKGQRVKAGEVIGYNGDSGNAESTSPHVHFEARDPSGTLVNPYRMLVGASRVVRSEAQRVADAPVGHVDSIGRSTDGTVEVWGWAIDRFVATSVKVSIYVGGNPVTTVSANRDRPDIAAAHPGHGPAHGLVVRGVAAPPGAQVCVVAHSIGGGGGIRLGCAVVP